MAFQVFSRVKEEKSKMGKRQILRTYSGGKELWLEEL